MNEISVYISYPQSNQQQGIFPQHRTITRPQQPSQGRTEKIQQNALYTDFPNRRTDADQRNKDIQVFYFNFTKINQNHSMNFTLETNYGQKIFDTDKMSIDVQIWTRTEPDGTRRQITYEYVNLDGDYELSPYGQVNYRPTKFSISNTIDAQKQAYQTLLNIIKSKMP